MVKEQKIGVVTGGSRGLGKNMALAIARSGIDVILTYRNNEAEASDTVKQIESFGRKAVALQLDMGNARELDGFVKKLTAQLESKWSAGKFDFLVNNAGMGATVPFLQVSEDLFDEFLHVHFRSVYFLTQKCIPIMNSGGRIINISSGTTRFSNPGYSVYASMKGAMEVFTRYLAKELGSIGIGANIVAPGPIETDFNNAAIRENAQLKSTLSSLTPLGRVGEPADIGGVVAFLWSPAASWINGQRIEVSGGING